jgi:hypothetical protein
MYSLTRVLHPPARPDGDRHQEGGQHDEQDRDPVHAHLVAQAQDPFTLLDELEAGVRRIEAEQDEERDDEGRRGGEERKPLRPLPRRRVVAAHEQREDDRRDQRQEGDDREELVFH